MKKSYSALSQRSAWQIACRRYLPLLTSSSISRLNSSTMSISSSATLRPIIISWWQGLTQLRGRAQALTPLNCTLQLAPFRFHLLSVHSMSLMKSMRTLSTKQWSLRVQHLVSSGQNQKKCTSPLCTIHSYSQPLTPLSNQVTVGQLPLNLPTTSWVTQTLTTAFELSE